MICGIIFRGIFIKTKKEVDSLTCGYELRVTVEVKEYCKLGCFLGGHLGSRQIQEGPT